MPFWPADEGTECRGGSVNLIIMRSIAERTKLLDEGVVPGSGDEIDETVLALRRERVSAIPHDRSRRGATATAPRYILSRAVHLTLQDMMAHILARRWA